MNTGSLMVAKFGGTCLGTPEDRERSVEHCREMLAGEACDRLVVVVSAMGRKGDPYATDTLLKLAPSVLPRERDLLLSCGEVISAVVMASLLRGSGVRAEALSGGDAGIVTDGVECDSRIERVRRQPLLQALKRAECIVVAGFQGLSTDGRITTLGRGGSDSSALALACALDAESVVLYKKVESVYTADPELVPGAMEIERISSEDLRQLGWQGAKIVHPRAAELAGEKDLPIEVRSHRTGKVVTEITPYVISTGRYISGVASGPEVVQFRVSSPDGAESSAEFFAEVFGRVAEAGVSMDMFSVYDHSAMFTVAVSSSETVAAVLEDAEISYRTVGPCTKVSIVGAGMHGMEGVMARFARALNRAGATMLQTVDSHATISALVELSQREAALRALHEEFLES
ncbi:aspartate kinase [Candidatus Fermentibacteria bacterium]|nr:aspartate kinase [Candidatus Fermentibacteria bacterium]